MKNIAIINAINLSPYALKRLSSHGTAIERVLEFSKKLPNVEKTVVLTTSESGFADKNIIIAEQESWDLGILLETIGMLSQGFDTIFYFFGDCPFLDSDVASTMFHNHVKYFADYSFADGYPYGITPEIISTRIVSQLQKLSSDSKASVGRESIFDIIKKDINSFDVETELSPEDVRFLRVKLCADCRRNFMLIDRMIELGAIGSLSILAVLKEKPDILRTLPSYYSIQIAEGCPHACSYCPYPVIRKNVTECKSEMKVEQFLTVLDKIEQFSEDAYINFSLWGEPALHSKIGDIIQACLTRDGLETIIETSGVGWNTSALKTIAEKYKKAPTWIVSLDALDKSTYERLRGRGFEEACGFTGLLSDLFPNKVYVQAVRMKENEEEVERFFNHWKPKTENLIIQKYDHFSNFLPERKVTDLSPLTRYPCWHNKRDVYVLLDGTVPLCREDLYNSYVLGNIFTDDLSAIWEKGKPFYLDHVSGKYNNLCERCDEYYTFNF